MNESPRPAADTAYFLSDLHLDSPDSPDYGRFVAFLEACSNRPAARIFWVGDVFDLWIADRPFFVRRHRRLIEAAERLIAAGWRLSYFEGNHDLDLQPFWGERVGAEIFLGPAYFELAGRTVRVEHGDQMDPGDRGYHFLRWVLRTRALRWAGRHLPNRLVAALGARASAASRRLVSSRGNRPVAVPIECAHIERALRERSFDDFVCGHTHARGTFGIQGRGQAFNLGCWVEGPVALVLDASGGWRWENI